MSSGELDITAAGYVPVGTLDSVGFATLWPTFRPASLEVYAHPQNLVRHLQGRNGYIERVAAFNHYGHLIPAALLDPDYYLIWEKVDSSEAGVSVVWAIPEGDDEECFLQVGVRVLSAEFTDPKLNYVSTIYPMSRSKFDSRRMKAKRVWCSK
jgi:hypothetical protein